MVISASELRPGKTIELDGNLVKVLDYTHNKTARGSAVIKIKIKNLDTGSNTERTFRSADKFNEARIESRKMQYLYKDGDVYNFMDNETFDQIEINESLLGDDINYLQENMELDIQVYQDRVLGISLPLSMIFEVTYTEPGMKGDTVNNVTKPATLDTGLIVQVPIFVNVGDKIKVDTRNSSYIERA